MSSPGNVRDEWWVEAKGYERELGGMLERRKAKEKLAEVLDYFGLEEPLPYKGHGFKRVKCPFHDDRKPSASVSSHYFRCHACNVHGDAIDLAMTQKGLSYAEAVRWVVGL